MLDHPPPPALPPMEPAPQKKQGNRSIKLMKLGQGLKDGLLKSNRLRRKHCLTNKANEAILAVLTHSREGDNILNKSVLDRCRSASRQMERILFSSGGAERIVTTLRLFKDRPAVKELGHVCEVMQVDNASLLLSKEEKLNSAIVKSLRGFVKMFSSRAGRRSNEDQNAYDAVMAALNNDDLTGAKLGCMLSRTLGASRRQLKKARELRAAMEDKDKARWVRKESAVPKNAIGEGTSDRFIAFIERKV